MPFLNLKVTGEKDNALTVALVELLTELTSSILGKNEELTSVCVEYISEGHWFINKTKLKEERTFFLHVNITSQTNTFEQKEFYLQEVYKGIKVLVGKVAKASYVVIHDTSADSWGFGGKSQKLRYQLGA